MPYKKKYGRKRFARRRHPRSNVWRASTVALRALNIARYVKSLVNVERKFLDTTFTSSMFTTAAIFPVSLIDQGDAYNQRQGNSVKLTSIYVSGTILGDPTQVNAQTIRYILFMDKEGRGVAPTITDLLEAATIQSPINHIAGKRFKILLDKQLTQSVAGAPNHTHQVKHFMKKSIHLKYNGPAALTSDTMENQLYFFVYGTSTLAQSPTAYITVRLRYIDN